MARRERGDRLTKRLDRLAGIPVVLALGLLHRRRQIPSGLSARRIGLLKTSAIGDTILLSGPAADLRQRFPEAEIILFAGSNNRDAARLIPSVDRVVELAVERPLRAVRQMRRQPVDLLLDFGSWPRINAFLCRFACARWRVGFRTPGQHRHYVYDLVVDHDARRHEIDNYRQLLRAIGVATGRGPSLSVVPGPPTRRIVAHMFSGGSRATLKEWPEDRWVEALGRLLGETDGEVVLTGSTVDRERAERVRARVGSDRLLDAAGDLDLGAAARMVASSSLVVSVDTGMLHLASALGVNLVALHGPTAPGRWGPLNANAVAIFKPRDCAPCLSLGFESRCRRPACLDAIEVDEVIAAARCLLRSGVRH